MYEWDLSATDRGLRLIISRMRLDAAAGCMAALMVALGVGYSLTHTDVVVYPVQAIVNAGVLAVAIGLLVWLWRRPNRVIFIAEFDIEARIASLAETSVTRTCMFNRRFDEITSIDTVLIPPSLLDRNRVQRFGIQFTFSDGVIFKPAGYDHDPSGKIRLLISDTRDATGIAGSPAPDVKPSLWDWFGTSRIQPR